MIMPTTRPAEQWATGEPGFYADVPSEIYHAHPAASNSRLTDMRQTPAHCRARMDEPKKPTPALVLGEAVHLAVLQPEIFEQAIAIVPKCDRRTKIGKAQWEDFLASSLGMIQLSQADYDHCCFIRDSVHRHHAARRLLEMEGLAEVSMLATHPVIGLNLKARIDYLCTFSPVIVDLKTTRDASKAEFAYSMGKLGYFRQAPIYMHMAAWLGRPIEMWAFIAVEKVKPYAVAVYQPEDDLLALGWEQAQCLMEQYRRCEETGKWPAYAADVQRINLDYWQTKRVAQDIENRADELYDGETPEESDDEHETDRD